MMRLQAVQTIAVPAEQETELGTVPIVGGAQTVTVTRGWFQCDLCGLTGAFDGMASPMMAPPCSQGCDPEQTQ
ncbi:MAG: hypothetical protein GY898_23155 [Proteobacteria bacterium]|nr:hypothetical protein [Pseudomonadota bacterium]